MIGISLIFLILRARNIVTLLKDQNMLKIEKNIGYLRAIVWLFDITVICRIWVFDILVLISLKNEIYNQVLYNLSWVKNGTPETECLVFELLIRW